MSECTHDCSTCSESCGERKEANVFEKKPLHEGCRVGKVYGVVSGKGGVGKNPVVGLLAAEFPCVVGLRIFEQHIPFPEAECSRGPGQPQQQLIFRLVAAGGLPQHLDVIGKIALIVCGVLVHNGFQRSDQVHIFKLLHGLHLQFFCLFPWRRLLALLLFCGIQLYPDGRLFRLGCA